MPKASSAARQPKCTAARASKKCNVVFQAAKGKVASDSGSAVGLGCSGSLSATDMARIFHTNAKAAGMGKSSVFVDVGCALGRPLVLVKHQTGVRRCIGLDLDVNKLRNADRFIKFCVSRLPKLEASHFTLILASVGILPLCPEFFYTFWEGWSVADKMHFAELFMRHGSRKGITVVQYSMPDPEAEMELLGFWGLKLVARETNCHMHDSNRTMTAFVFKVVMYKKPDSSSSGGSGSLATQPQLAAGTAAAAAGQQEGETAAAAASTSSPPLTTTAAWRTNMLPLLRKAQEKQQQLVELVGAVRGGRGPLLKPKEVEQLKLSVMGEHAEREVQRASEFKEVGFAPDYEVNPHGVIRHKVTHTPALLNRGNDGHLYARLAVRRGSGKGNSPGGGVVEEETGDEGELATTECVWSGAEKSKDHKMAVRTVVALAHLQGAQQALVLTPGGTQVRKLSRSTGIRVAHKDGDMDNNCVDNLELRARARGAGTRSGRRPARGGKGEAIREGAADSELGCWIKHGANGLVDG
ncbi:hypothetical protein VOLCADRAFT_100605 [Volvox carteri f. nagariensis]|uniref:Methyltransferase domain-containing protein n=1 Tax=Volvox carteri f. nagariensis TaxID=3068 RepID=D8UKL6_VOLCA|nr:uncharacterized protein VOLCADRAFT_100605 [Volvox carteri f. nagariensis]EFJ39736.1 hypothetical protein VOLCADRAFT_100605 [Volvox carteri f. nagariensis]|eukprot:XP_002959199.1 hypothetical protein VOLCADRAFT_100605 [Volvox carteri f. nagariensis]